MHFKMESNGLVSVLQYELDQQKYFSHGFERGVGGGDLEQISLFQSSLILLNHTRDKIPIERNKTPGRNVQLHKRASSQLAG